MTSRAFVLGACLPVVSRREGRSAVPASGVELRERHIGNLLFCKGMAATVHALCFTAAATMLRRQP